MNPETNFDRAMHVIKQETKNARKRLVEKLEPLLENVGITPPKSGGKEGIGTSTKYNDRTMYAWISVIGLDGKEYVLNLFYSEIDEGSGNCHCQLGRLMFVDGWLTNGSKITSPNKILKLTGDDVEKLEESNHDTFGSDKVIVFHSSKWHDPLKYTTKLTAQECCNGKWLTVADVNRDENVAALVAEAFIQFIPTEAKKQR